MYIVEIVEQIFKLDINDLNKMLEDYLGIDQFFPNEKDLQKFRLTNPIEEYQKPHFQIPFKNPWHESPVSEKHLRELGDFQTPMGLCFKLCLYLQSQSISPKVIIEPTMGQGNFIIAALATFSDIELVYGVETQEKYLWDFKIRLLNLAYHLESLDGFPMNQNSWLYRLLNGLNPKTGLNYSSFHISLVHDNIFSHNISFTNLQLMRSQINNVSIKTTKNINPQILLLGNPPWVTNTEQSKSASSNVPKKSNFKKERGIDSITGKGNFDIAETVILRAWDLASTSCSDISQNQINFAFLCKNSVIRNLLAKKTNLHFPIGLFRALNIDESFWFKINAHASAFLFLSSQQKYKNQKNNKIQETPQNQINNENQCDVLNFENPQDLSVETHYIQRIGYLNGLFINNLENYCQYAFLDAPMPFEWRQGVKHDLQKVMVLTTTPQTPNKRINLSNPQSHIICSNQLGEEITLENDLLFPFLRGSNLKAEIFSSFHSSQLTSKERNCYLHQKTIMTQKKIGDDTTGLSNLPLTWQYLQKHKSKFDARKSSIYENKPAFSIFGVGPYSFKPFKIAIAAMYKQLHFSFLFPLDEKPVQLDDTCYFLSFDHFSDAFFTFAIFKIQYSMIQSYFHSIVTLRSKRPWKKDILMRLNLEWLAEHTSLNELEDFYRKYFSPIQQDYSLHIAKEYPQYLQFLKESEFKS